MQERGFKLVVDTCLALASCAEVYIQTEACAAPPPLHESSFKADFSTTGWAGLINMAHLETCRRDLSNRYVRVRDSLGVCTPSLFNVESAVKLLSGDVSTQTTVDKRGRLIAFKSSSRFLLRRVPRTVYLDVHSRRMLRPGLLKRLSTPWIDSDKTGACRRAVARQFPPSSPPFLETTDSSWSASSKPGRSVRWDGPHDGD